MDRLRYSIHAVSSEDVDAPAVGLTETGPQVRGWQCSKRCTYPQELFLRLDRVTKLQQIQLLSHEYKIPTKLELFVGVLPPGTTPGGVGQMTWKRLGSMPFDSNERSGFQARELKSVHVNTEAQYLRVVLHKPHPNQYNLHNQVGLVAVKLHGSVEEEFVEPALPVGLPAGPVLARNQSMAGNFTSTSSHGRSEDQPNVDSLTARKIAELRVKKDAAVAEENYDEAKALKLEIDRLKSIGSRILELENRKQLAIQEEDYDTAKAIKGEITKVRAGGLPTVADKIAIRVDASVPPQSAGVSPSISEIPAVARRSRQSWDGTGARPEAASNWEQPAAPRDLSALEQEAAELSMSGTADANSGLGPAPPDWPTGLPPPEPLSAADTKDADDVSELLGPYVAAAMYSKSWQLREAALQQLEHFLGQQDPEKQRAALPAATRAIQRAIKERVPNVFQAGLQVLTQLVEACAKAMGREAASLTSDVLPTLLDKIGDSNSRIQSTASDAILRLAKVKESGLSSLATTFVRQQRQTAWRPVLARLQLLTNLVPIWGLASAGGEGLPLEGLMKFVGAAFGNANAEVRSAAIALAVLVHKTAGGAVVQKLLPRDLNPKIREQIEAATKPPGSPPVPAVAARRASSDGRKPASERRQSGGSQTANERPPSPPPAISTASPRINLEQEEASVLNEDPTPYQLELVSREQILGANHPEVAVSLSNLAILHNQRGEFAQAQPLYERALAIFEMNFGPFNANVAHTLTDLAVLHLEQGNVEAGRPLLERALVIQEKALGPNHPDVTAIRDVLDDTDE